MPFTLIKGTFHVVNYSPDGDSVRFGPDDRTLFDRLDGPPARFNARGHTQLRVEAIDSLETHYAASGTTVRQPPAFANQATDFLFRFFGITNVVWNAQRSTVVSANDGTRGYILSREVEKNQRAVAFAFAGDPAEPDGSTIGLDVVRLRTSYNHAVLSEGLAYPTYYSGLFYDLRAELTRAVADARANTRGVWSVDVTTAGFDVHTLADITDTHVILPKLFRRLSDYVVQHSTTDGFKEHLATLPDPVLDLVNCHMTNLDTFVEQTDGSPTIHLTRAPEDLVFLPLPPAPVMTVVPAAVAGEAAFVRLAMF